MSTPEATTAPETQAEATAHDAAEAAIAAAAPAPLPPLPPIAHAPKDPVHVKPLLLMYKDAASKPHILIAGDGNGQWLLPKREDITHDALDTHEYHLTPQPGFEILNFGDKKPELPIAHHAIYSWVSLDLAKVILGQQFDALPLQQLQTEPLPSPTAPRITPIQPEALTGAETPVRAIMAHTAQHQHVAPALAR
jgi:hypothetical protein